jgi:flagellar M-ring protein FliF
MPGSQRSRRIDDGLLAAYRIVPPMNALFSGFRALGAPRLVAMGAVALGIIAVLGLLVFHSGNQPMALLYGDLDAREAGQVIEQLGRRHIPYRIDAGGSQIMVPADMVPEARVMLARDGLPASGSIGYEIFDRGDSLAFSDFQQKINETRALEGELVRTIRAIRGVRGARVHLVLPRREAFARDRQDAQASVMLTMAGAARPDREGVQAILNLVAAAVPGLRPQNIAIIDSRGDLLARAGEPVGQSAAVQSAEEMRHATELRLARAVEEMLERSLGPGHVRAEAAVRMNFDRINETQERFDPDGQVTRSTQSVTSNSKSTEASSTVSVQNNLPNADAGNAGNGSQEQRQEETTNYEISKTVRTLIREQPQIDRVSLAVMVDGEEITSSDGKRTWQARSAEELARIASLVKTAIGYDEKRGDQVEVASLRFASDLPLQDSSEPAFFGVQFLRHDVMRLAETGMVGLVALLALLFVLRPMVNKVIALPAPQPAAALIGAANLVQGEGEQPGGAGGPENMVDVAQIEGQMRASSLRRLGELVDRHPQEALAIVRGWLTQPGTVS